MNTSSPFSFLESFAQHLQPPTWLVAEVQQRLVLFFNHVLMQEKEAQMRLARRKGSVIHIRLGTLALNLLVTPAGLTDRAPSTLPADLTLTIATEAPWVVAQSFLEGKAPPVKIEGDVQLAAELGWLADNLRWDVEEDLSRIVGDVPSHAIVGAGQRLLVALRDFVARAPRSPFAAGRETSPAPASATTSVRQAGT